MKWYARIAVAVLCAALILGIPFFLSSPKLLSDAESDIFSEDYEEDSLDFGWLFFSSAMAEDGEGYFEAEEIDVDEPTRMIIPEEWELPFDFTVPPEPDPDHFTDNGYEDQSIRVRVEHLRLMDSDVCVAHVEIASPSQLRTAMDNRENRIPVLANANNAVIAMNGDFFRKDSNNKFFEIRMTKKVKVKKTLSKQFDTLVIDKNGDLHVFIVSEGLKEYRDQHMDDIANAYMFGPALVKDGEIVERKNSKYMYAPNGHDGRSAIGQTGPLSYVLVLVEGHKKDSKGVTHAQLAQIMYDLGCIQAYNLDGGNSANLYMQGADKDIAMLDARGNNEAPLRPQSDILYFATAVPLEERN